MKVFKLHLVYSLFRKTIKNTRADLVMLDTNLVFTFKFMTRNVTDVKGCHVTHPSFRLPLSLCVSAPLSAPPAVWNAQKTKAMTMEPPAGSSKKKSPKKAPKKPTKQASWVVRQPVQDQPFSQDHVLLQWGPCQYPRTRKRMSARMNRMWICWG